METLARALRAAGCDAAIANDGHCRIVIDGEAARVTAAADGLTLQRSVCGDDLTLDLGRVNEANHRVRFARYSIENGRLVMRCDLGPDVDDPATRTMAIWRLVMADMRRLVIELAETPGEGVGAT